MQCSAGLPGYESLHFTYIGVDKKILFIATRVIWQKRNHRGDNIGHNLTLNVYQFPSTTDPSSHIVPTNGRNEGKFRLARLLLRL